ncbi:flagellar hook-length control protein FliK [Shewanella carassii]|nr:flagellar hook-length control protein FliK [Shewanella carassii]
MQQLSNIFIGGASSKEVTAKDALQPSDNEAFLSEFQHAKAKFSLEPQGPKREFSEPRLTADNAEEEALVDVSLILGQIAMGKKLPVDADSEASLSEAAGLQEQIAALTGLDEDEFNALSPEEQAELLATLKLAQESTSDGLEGALDKEGDSEAAESDTLEPMLDETSQGADTQNPSLFAADKASAKTNNAGPLESPEQQMGWPDGGKPVTKAAPLDGMAALAREGNLNTDGGKSDNILAPSAVVDKAKLDASGKLGTEVAAAATTASADSQGDKTATKEVLASLLKTEMKGAQVGTEVRSPVSDAIHQALKGDAASTQTDISPFQQQLHQQGLQPAQRGEMAQFQLSLRQGMEQSVQTADMVQRFAPVMRQQLIAMVSNGVQQAEIRLDPPELGAMMVRVQVHGDQTQVQFHVTQAQTRDMLEQAMPRLREMLQEQGMNLADSHISQGGREQGEPQGGNGGGFAQDGVEGEISAEETTQSANRTTSYGSGIDYYA